MPLVLIAAHDTQRARHIALTRGFRRWVLVRDGSDVVRRPDASLYVDHTAPGNHRFDTIADAFMRRANTHPGPFGLPR